MRLTLTTNKGAVVKQWDDIPPDATHTFLSRTSLGYWLAQADRLDEEDRMADTVAAITERKGH